MQPGINQQNLAAIQEILGGKSSKGEGDMQDTYYSPFFLPLGISIFFLEVVKFFREIQRISAVGNLRECEIASWLICRVTSPPHVLGAPNI